MKLQHLLLTALFLFTINVSNAQSVKRQALEKTNRQDIREKNEHSLKKIDTGQSLHLEEITLAMGSQRSSLSVDPPAPNLVMATIYVKSDATGNNDGTSWENAFTDLQVALSTAPMGDQIWVAAGTYQPGNSDSSTFHLSYDLELYGGFAGTENSIDDRDIENNPTILSGDLNGNDVDDDFETNREDNVLNVMRIENTVTTATVIDGFTIQNGQADGDTLIFTEVRGAGVMSFGAAQFYNCTFQQNYATYYGGGLYFRDSLSAGGKVTNCRFEKNESREERGGGIVAVYVSGEGIEVNSCQFTDNRAIRGGGAYFLNSQVTVSNSEFTDNTSEEYGGAIYNFMSGENEYCEISNSTFTNNTSEGSGGAIYNYIDGEDEYFEISNSTFTNNSSDGRGGAVRIIVFTDNATSNINNCTFENNEANAGGAVAWSQDGMNNHISFTGSDFQNNNAIGSGAEGGAIYCYFRSASTISSAIVDDCTFTNNSSAQDGGAISNFMQNEGHICEVTNSTFTENRAIDLGWGGAIYSGDVGTNDTLNVENCVFSLNTTENVGGGVQEQTTGTNHYSSIHNCQFLNNHADYYGGGYRLQGTDSNFQLKIEDCLFDGNNAIVDGGGFEIAQYDQAHCDLAISNTMFQNNTSGNQGAGLNFWTDDDATADIFIENAHFDGNENDASGVAAEGAGGLTLINLGSGVVKIDIKSSVFENNVSEDGAGAIQLRKPWIFAGDVVSIENSLLTNNSGGDYAGGIGVVGAINLSVKSTTIADNNGGITLNDGLLELQNTILYNPGSSDFISAGVSSANSLGGNLVGDITLTGTLNGTDFESEDPLFIGSGDYQLTENSPGVDKGILTDDVTDFDLEGNARVNGCLDIGAYESPFLVSSECITSTKEILIDNSMLTVFPNPITDQLNVHLENDWKGEVQIQIVNLLGQNVYTANIEKNIYESNWSINTSHLSKGVYQLMISNGKEMVVETLTKL